MIDPWLTGVRDSRLEAPKEAEFTMVDQATYTLAIVETIVLGGLAVLAVVRLIGNEWVTESWLWLSMLVVGVTLGAYKIIGRANERAAHLICGRRSFRIVRNQKVVDEVEYSSIKSYTLLDPNSEDWLYVELRGSKGSFSIPRSDYSYGRGDAAQGLVKAMGPALPDDVEQSRGPRPSNIIRAIQFDHFWSVPSVVMVPGRIYRYVSPKDMREELWGSSRRHAYIPGAVPLIAFTSSAIRYHDWESVGMTIGVAITLISMALLVARPKGKFTKSLDDRFEAVPEGIRVTRGEKSWVIRDPVRTRRLGLMVRLADEPVPVYRDQDGLPYYFDSRFIEPVQ